MPLPASTVRAAKGSARSTLEGGQEEGRNQLGALRRPGRRVKGGRDSSVMPADLFSVVLNLYLLTVRGFLR